MAKITPAERLAYVQKYVRDIFADTLKREGFVSPDGKDTIWYRVVNHEVVNTICFFSLWSAAPISLSIGYGIHPLFVEPFQTNTVHISNFPYNAERLFDMFIKSAVEYKNDLYHRKLYAPNVPVEVSIYPDKGLYTLEEIILPIMNVTKTKRDCYELHKARYLELFGPDFFAKASVSLDFINEAIYFEDTELYPQLQHEVIKQLRRHEEHDHTLRGSKWLKWARERLVHLEYQKKALLEDDRGAFLESMEQRRKKTVDLLEKKFKIQF